MKRNDWAGGCWAKAAAFLLAVVLVPVLLSYGTALAFSYSGELRGEFYESSILNVDERSNQGKGMLFDEEYLYLVA